MESFKISPENEDKITKDEAKFILDQAEKSLKEIGDLSKEIVGRSTTLISIVSGVLIAIVAFIANKWETKGQFDSTLVTAILLAFYLFFICFRLTRNFKAQDYYPLGTEPAKLMVNDFFTAPTEEKREIWFYIAEIKRCQIKIEINRERNNERWKNFNKDLGKVIQIPVGALIVYVILTIFFQVVVECHPTF
jgi:4-amino-4-deoxy-L-arabinose transferase-like glycosyltransferase